MTMFEAQTLEFPFVERMPKREKSKFANLWDELREATKEGMPVQPVVAAKLLGVSRQRVYDLIDNGTLRTVDFNGNRYVTENSIVDYCRTERKAGRPVSIPMNNKEALHRAVEAGRAAYEEHTGRRKR